MSDRHKYEYKVDLNADTAAAKVVHMVGSGKRVLEIGAGPGSITRLLVEHGHCKVSAVELDTNAIEKLGDFCEEIHNCDLNDPSWTRRVTHCGNFDVVVAADVLEHLYDPWTTLSAMKTILNKDGYIVVSLPHIGHNAIISCLLGGNFEYQEWGLLDKTHIRFFSIKNIQKLFAEAGLKIVEAGFVIRAPEQTEFSAQWKVLSPESKRELEKNKFGNIYQVVVKAVPESTKGQALNLLSLDIPFINTGASSGASFKSRIIFLLKNTARTCLSMKMRSRISNILNRAGIKL